MRYPGGKGKAYQHIINLMPPHRVYIETHLGGGAVMRQKRPAERNIGIDADCRVIAEWSIVRHVQIELVCGTAENFLTNYQFRGDELVYADPPYHPQARRRRRVYSHDYTDADHQRLLTLLKSLPCMVILSGYAHALYDKELVSWSTRSFLAKTHAGVREETLWFNFETPQVLHDTRYMGNDFRQRQATKRRLGRLQEKVRSMDAVERAAFAQWLNTTYPIAPGSAPP